MQTIFSNNEFTTRVRNYLLERYGVVYDAQFVYTAGTDFNPNQYSLAWLENNQDKPMIMVGDFEDEDSFFNYVCKEIDTRRFFLKKVFVLVRTDSKGRT